MRSFLPLLLVLVSWIAAPADAARVGNTVTGTVLLITPGQTGDSTAALAALGVSQGATVELSFGVESTTPPEQITEVGTFYFNPFTDWMITIGNFAATLNPATLHQVSVSDNRQGTDRYIGSGFMTVTNDVLGDGTNASFAFSEFGTGAISNENPAQDVSAFDAGAGAIGGTNAVISIEFDFGSGPPAPPRCLPEQINSSAALCRAVIQCYGKIGTGPGLFPCIDAAEAKFIAAFDKASDKADKKGESCPSGLDGTAAADELSDDVDPLSALVGDGANPDSKDDTKYRAGIYKAAAGAVDKGLKAYGKDAKKPDAEKLEASLDKVEAKLEKSLAKTEAKGDKKGVDTNVDPAAVVNAVSELVGSVLGVANGDE